MSLFNDTFKSEPAAQRRQKRSIVSEDSFKNEFGQEVIKVIKDRTLSGKDASGDSFATYSPKYKDSRIFKIYKGGANSVNLKLTGDMQNDMDTKSLEGFILQIYFPDRDEAAKAHGHIVGARYLPKRDFFNISYEDQKDIMKRVVNQRSLFTALESVVDEINVDQTTNDYSIDVDIDEEE